MMSVCAIYGEGAPSLRFLQRRVTMLPTQLLWLCNPVAHAFQVPALCKVRKGRGTHFVFLASEVKSLDHPLNVGAYLSVPKIVQTVWQRQKVLKTLAESVEAWEETHSANVHAVQRCESRNQKILR